MVFLPFFEFSNASVRSVQALGLLQQKRLYSVLSSFLRSHINHTSFCLGREHNCEYFFVIIDICNNFIIRTVTPEGKKIPNIFAGGLNWDLRISE